MVDRQYELMRRPRMMDDLNNSKNPTRPDDVEMQNSVEHPAPNTATEAPVSDHEVNDDQCNLGLLHLFFINLNKIRFFSMLLLLLQKENAFQILSKQHQ